MAVSVDVHQLERLRPLGRLYITFLDTTKQRLTIHRETWGILLGASPPWVLPQCGYISFVCLRTTRTPWFERKHILSPLSCNPASLNPLCHPSRWRLNYSLLCPSPWDQSWRRCDFLHSPKAIQPVWPRSRTRQPAREAAQHQLQDQLWNTTILAPARPHQYQAREGVCCLFHLPPRSRRRGVRDCIPKALPLYSGSCSSSPEEQDHIPA